MTKIMMTGANGRIGKGLREYGVLPLSGDVTNPSNLADTVLFEKPDIIVHLAALSNVDFCERPENKEKVIDVNLRGTFNVLDVAEQVGAKVVMLSTDHVFDGGKGFLHKRGPYKETDKPNPINFYGLSKYHAEALQQTFDNFHVVRTSYLFDWERLNNEQWGKKYFPTFIYRSFLYLPTFISIFYAYLQNIEKMPKMLHISGSESVSWYEFMHHIVPDAQPRDWKSQTENTGGYTPRPLWGGLKTKYKLFIPYSYLEGIQMMLQEKK